MLSVKNLWVSFGKRPVLNGLSLILNEGEIVELSGDNGSGKSTLLKILAGIHPQNHGQILFNNSDISRLSVKQRNKLGITVVLQKDNTFPSLTVTENLFLACHYCRDRQARFDEVLGIIPEISHLLGKRAGLLSGGQRQRVAVAMGLIQQPKLLLLDEPTASLDEKSGGQILDSIQSWIGQSDRAALIVSHESIPINVRRLVLFDGRIREQ